MDYITPWMQLLNHVLTSMKLGRNHITYTTKGVIIYQCLDSYLRYISKRAPINIDSYMDCSHT